MANTSFTQQALAAEPQFGVRVRAQLIIQAFVVLAEAPVTSPPAAAATYQARVTFARQVINDSNREAQRIIPILVMRTNLMSFTTSYDFTQYPNAKIVTAAGDADILSQLATDWNAFAGTF